VKGLRRPLRTLRSQVQLLVGSLILLLVVSAISTLLVQHKVRATQLHLRHTLRPAQVAVAMLGEAYVDQETGERGYLLTGDTAFLQPYTAGQAHAARFRRQLGHELAGDPESARLLARVDSAAAAWRTRAAGPEINKRMRVPVSGSNFLPEVRKGKVLFDDLRSALASLDGHVNHLAAVTVAEIDSAQATANSLTIAAGVAALALMAVAGLVLRNSLSRPLTDLVGQVQRVADGDLGHSVAVSGPAELVAVADAVERMRVRILAQVARTMEMQRQIALTEEMERIATGLQDRVVMRLSGTGLILQSAASRHPAAATALSDAVDEMDKAIQELRSVVFGLTTRHGSARLHERVLNLVAENESSLGFSPQLRLDGMLEANLPQAVADEAILALREILSNIARHAEASDADISLGVTNRELRLRVTDNGKGLPPARDTAGHGTAVGLASLTESAERLGGHCRIGGSGNMPGGGPGGSPGGGPGGSPGGGPGGDPGNGRGGNTAPANGGGTVIEWIVPLRGA
jgi:signal transduction histidine kinase